MDTIKVVIRKDTGAIEITPELVEQALNFYFGMGASVTVFAAVEQPRALDSASTEPQCECGGKYFHSGCKLVFQAPPSQ